MASSPKPDPVPAASVVVGRNDPYDRSAPIQIVVPEEQDSRQYMQSIRTFVTPTDAIAIWYLGQNGFLLRGGSGPLIAIDPYLSNSCATSFGRLPFRLDRQLPVFIAPEDLDVDVFVTTHSHQDHADPETIRAVAKKCPQFVGPFDSMRVYRECGAPESRCRLIHPGESVDLGGATRMTATFALPTDDTDLNHTGVVLDFANGIRFYNTGDTAYAERLGALLPKDVDICAICINGGFHNLAAMEAAELVKAIGPRVVIPCHYDMMINNLGSPDSFRVCLDLVGSESVFKLMPYYRPWLYRRD